MTDRLFPLTEERASDTILTPPSLFQLLDLTFALDPAGAIGGDFVPADRRYTVTDDGLAHEWGGERVWLNPPYSKPEPWVDRFIANANGIILVPVSRSYWQARLWRAADAIALPDTPFSFHEHNGFPYAVQLAAFGSECVEAIGRWGRAR